MKAARASCAILPVLDILLRAVAEALHSRLLAAPRSST